MFYHVDEVNSKRTGIKLQTVMMILFSLLFMTLVIFIAFDQANAYQTDDNSVAGQTVSSPDLTTPINVVEEIDLGDQGVFPEGHTLATIHVDGKVYTVDTEGVLFEELDELYGFTLSDQDFVVKAYNEFGYDLTVNRMVITTSTEEVSLDYKTEYKEDDDLLKGKEKTKVEGEKGIQIDTYQTRVLNGETTTKLISSEISKEPVNEVILVGTKEPEPEKPKSSSSNSSSSGSSSSGSSDSSSSSSSSSGDKSTGYSNSGSYLSLTSETITSINTESKTFTTSSGKTYSYSRKLDCEATAYSDPGGITAKGTSCREGCIAVDPKVIPLGSWVYVITSNGSIVYGEAVCEDTGGVIKGNLIDLYYDSESTCRDFGRRSVTVFVLN